MLLLKHTCIKIFCGISRTFMYIKWINCECAFFRKEANLVSQASQSLMSLFAWKTLQIPFRGGNKAKHLLDVNSNLLTKSKGRWLQPIWKIPWIIFHQPGFPYWNEGGIPLLYTLLLVAVWVRSFILLSLPFHSFHSSVCSLMCLSRVRSVLLSSNDHCFHSFIDMLILLSTSLSLSLLLASLLVSL